MNKLMVFVGLLFFSNMAFSVVFEVRYNEKLVGSYDTSLADDVVKPEGWEMSEAASWDSSGAFSALSLNAHGQYPVVFSDAAWSPTEYGAGLHRVIGIEHEEDVIKAYLEYISARIREQENRYPPGSCRDSLPFMIDLNENASERGGYNFLRDLSLKYRRDFLKSCGSISFASQYYLAEQDRRNCQLTIVGSVLFIINGHVFYIGIRAENEEKAGPL